MSQVDTRGLTLLAVAGFASAAAFRICDPLLPKLAQAFETTTGSAARVITAFSIAYGLLQLLYGPIGDRYGKYRVVATATLACTVGSVGCATVGSLNWLILFRVIAGATAARSSWRKCAASCKTDGLGSFCSPYVWREPLFSARLLSFPRICIRVSTYR